jgi:hypothetical protein
VQGDSLRKTRLHTYRGELPDPAAFAYLPHAVGSTLLLKLLSVRLELPWLGFRGVRALDSLLKQDFSVLEFGSGMSSLFFARRCRSLVSIETDRVWYDDMKRRFTTKGVTNVDYRYRDPDAAELTDLGDLEDGSLDLVLVDSTRRAETLRAALPKVRPGGHVYLDNSDAFPDARATLIEAAGVSGSIQIFRDFCPFQLVVTEGVLARVGAPAG